MSVRLINAIKKLYIGLDTAYNYLVSHQELGMIKKDPNFKLNDKQYEALEKEFIIDKALRNQAVGLFPKRKQKNSIAETHNSVSAEVTNKGKEGNNSTLGNIVSRSIHVKIEDFQYDGDNLVLFFGGHIYHYGGTNKKLFYLNKGNLPNELLSQKLKLTLYRLNDSQEGTFYFANEREIKSLFKKKDKQQSTITKKGVIIKPQDKIKNENKTIKVKLSQLVYTKRYIGYNMKRKKTYRLYCSHNLASIQQKKYALSIFQNIVNIVLDNQRKLFWFEDSSVLNEIEKIVFGNIKEHDNRKRLNENQLISKTRCCIDNIEFHSGYYLVKLQSDSFVKPLRIEDISSRESLRYVTNYLADKFPTDIEIIYNPNSVISLSKPYKIEEYIRFLSHKLEEDGEWWNDIIDSYPEFDVLKKVPYRCSRKRIPLTKEYLVFLISQQSETKKLIPTYEIRHGAYEYSFIFSVFVGNGDYAIIHENVEESSTSTELFIVAENNYEKSVQKIFEYFSNEIIENKRLSLQHKKVNPALFLAKKYDRITHCGLSEWAKTLYNKIGLLKEPLFLKFTSGIKKNNLHHNERYDKLFEKTCAMVLSKYGLENVGSDIEIGEIRMDLVVKMNNAIQVYFIQTYETANECFKESLGKIYLCSYLLDCELKKEFVIVGPANFTDNLVPILDYWKKSFNLSITYMKI